MDANDAHCNKYGPLLKCGVEFMLNVSREIKNYFLRYSNILSQKIVYLYYFISGMPLTLYQSSQVCTQHVYNSNLLLRIFR